MENAPREREGGDGAVRDEGKDAPKAGGEGGLCPLKPSRSLDLRMPGLIGAGHGSLWR